MGALLADSISDKATPTPTPTEDGFKYLKYTYLFFAQEIMSSTR